jgi:hypothetical protein
MTEKGAKRYNTSVLRGLIWSTPALFHRVIHSICGIALPAEFAAGTVSSQTVVLQPLFRFVVLVEAALFRFEFRGVDHETGVVDAGLVFQVEHFVEHDVFDDMRRNSG